MRALVTGGAGVLGRALLRTGPPGAELTATRHRRGVPSPVRSHEVDLAEAGPTDVLLATLRPDVVIHTAYDREDGDRNIIGATRNVARACAGVGATLVHVSSDVVFDGDAAPYREDAPRQPKHRYGRQKADAEDEVLERVEGAAVVRTSLLLGSGSTEWMVEALTRDTADLHVDELRSPIHPDHLAAALWEIALLPGDERGGNWHVVGPEVISRYALGLLLARHHGLDPTRVRPSSCPDDRPRDLRLSTARADARLLTRPWGVSQLLARP